MRKKLGEILVEQGAVGQADVDAAIEAQSMGDPARIGDLLLAGGKVTPLQLARALCTQSGLPFVRLDQVSPEVAALVPIALQREHCLVPFKEDGPRKAIHVAVADPTTRDVLAELEFQVGRSLKISIAARDEIEAVHAALQGDVLEAAIVEDDAPPPSSKPLGRLALKRVAVSPDGVMSEVVPSPGPGSYLPTVEMPLVEDAVVAPPSAPPPPAPAVAAQPLPQRAARPKAAPVPPPVLKPVDPRPSDEWAVRPAASAIPRGAPRPAEAPAPPVLDPFASMPTEEIGGPRDYVPLSGLPEKVLSREAPIATSVQFPVAAAPMSKLAIEPAPLSLTPPLGRKPLLPRKPIEALEAVASKPPPPRASPSLGVLELTIESAALTDSMPRPQPVPSGREKRMETQLEFNPPAVSIRESHVGTQPEGRPFFEDRSVPVKTDPAWPGVEVTAAPDKVKTDPEKPSAPTRAAPAKKTGSAPAVKALDGNKPRASTKPSSPKLDAVKAEAPRSEARDDFELPELESLKPWTPEGEALKSEPDPLDALTPWAPEPVLPRSDAAKAEPLQPPPSQKLKQPSAQKSEELSTVEPLAELLHSTARKPGLLGAAPAKSKPSSSEALLQTSQSEPQTVETPLPEAEEPEPPKPNSTATQPARPGLVRPAAPTAVENRRVDSLEFIPPAESAPPPPARVDALEYVPPSAPPTDLGLDGPPTRVDHPRAATPPGGTPVSAGEPLDDAPATPYQGEPVITAPVGRPALDEASAATPPDGQRAIGAENLVSAAVVPPATLAPPNDDVPAAAAAAGAVLTAAPVEEPPPAPPSAPTLSPAPIDLAVSELPEWMRDAASAVPNDDPLVALLTEAGTAAALARVLRLLIKRGALSEAELIEELKKR